MEQARTLAKAGQLDEAATHYVWAWRQISKLGPEQVASRDMTMGRELTALAHDSQDAKKKLVELRDAAAEPVTGGSATPEQIREWVVLNTVVGEGERTLDWFDRQKKRSDAQASFRTIEWALVPMLERRNRWSDVLVVLGDPSARLDEGLQTIDKARKAKAKEKGGAAQSTGDALDAAIEATRVTSVRTYAALLGSNQQPAAERFARGAIEADPGPAMKMGLVDAALRVGKAVTAHGAWLSEAEVAGADVTKLRQRWSDAMKVAAAPHH